METGGDGAGRRKWEGNDLDKETLVHAYLELGTQNPSFDRNFTVFGRDTFMIILLGQGDPLGNKSVFWNESQVTAGTAHMQGQPGLLPTGPWKTRHPGVDSQPPLSWGNGNGMSGPPLPHHRLRGQVDSRERVPRPPPSAQHPRGRAPRNPVAPPNVTPKHAGATAGAPGRPRAGRAHGLRGCPGRGSAPGSPEGVKGGPATSRVRASALTPSSKNLAKATWAPWQHTKERIQP